jgi:lipopolysaccharide transport system permease protein
MLASEQASPPPASPAAAPTVQGNEIVIQPARGWIGVDWAELVRYRELLSFLVWRDVKVKYKQAVLGLAWSVLLPIISLCVYGGVALASGFSAKLAGDPAPPLMIWMFAGLVPWLFLQRAISDGGMSLVSNQALMTKIYLPRLYLPLSACGNALVDMTINVGLLGLIGLACFVQYGWAPGWQIVFVVPLVALLFVAALGLAFTLSAATVLYRDLRFIIPFIVQFGLWLSAVPFPLNLFGERTKMLFALNPLTGIISGFRSAITGQPWEWLHLGTSVVLSVALLTFGLFYFKRVERLFADIA